MYPKLTLAVKVMKTTRSFTYTNIHIVTQKYKS